MIGVVILLLVIVALVLFILNPRTSLWLDRMIEYREGWVWLGAFVVFAILVIVIRLLLG